ncbi:hypothetical protein ACRAWF_45975 [Streptomyces sp. L7]
MARLAVVLVEDRLIGGAQGDAALLQLVLDLRAEVGAARDTFDGLADHGRKSAGWTVGLVQEVADAAVAGDGDGEAFVGGAVAAGVEVLGGRIRRRRSGRR